MNFNANVMGIAIETRMPIGLIRERLLAAASKYHVTADDVSAAVLRGVILGHRFDIVMEIATAYIAQGFRPRDIDYTSSRQGFARKEMRTTPKIVVTLEGNSWQEILQEMRIVQECARNRTSASRIEDNPGKVNVAPTERSLILGRLDALLKNYDLGPEERAEILERMR